MQSIFSNKRQETLLFKKNGILLIIKNRKTHTKELVSNYTLYLICKQGPKNTCEAVKK